MNTTKESNALAVMGERLMQVEKSLAEVRQELFATKKKFEDALLARASEPREFNIPPELNVDRATRGNKLPEKVARRWAVWQQQYINGMSISSIARAWDCDRRSVQYAKRNGWKAKYL
jgi:hypothetical protein